jgi:hypothetical protein
MKLTGRKLKGLRGGDMQVRKWLGLLRPCLLWGSLTLVIAPSGFATTITVNGSCEVGNCTHPGILGVGQMTSGTASFNYTFADTDRYHIVVVFSASDSGGTNFSISTAGLATYRGNASGTDSGTDVLTIDFSQYYDSFITSGTFQENIFGTFGGQLGEGSNVTFQLFQGGQPMPLLGPFFPPSSFSDSVSGFPIMGLDNPLNTTAVFSETFASGSAVGADMNLGGVKTPEPGTVLLFGAGLTALVGVRRKRAMGQAGRQSEPRLNRYRNEYL